MKNYALFWYSFDASFIFKCFWYHFDNVFKNYIFNFFPCFLQVLICEMDVVCE